MKDYDVVVIGAGVGADIAFRAVEAGRTVALVAAGPAGGTCINTGCLPSKMLIQAADAVVSTREAARLAVRATVERVDFPIVMGRMREAVAAGRRRMEGYLLESHGLDWYRDEGRFTGERTVRVGGEEIRGRQVFIASGSRPLFPLADGLGERTCLTSDSVLDLQTLPARLIVLGGGYVGVEYAHFFAAMGAEVTIVQRNRRLLPREEPEVSDLLLRELGRRARIILDAEVSVIEHPGTGCRVTVRAHAGAEETIEADLVIAAVGRGSNADTLDTDRAGVALDEQGWIMVDGGMHTSAQGVWAVGDAQGRAMFTPAGHREAQIAWHNALLEQEGTGGRPLRMEFDLVPHAVFTWPQIASVGLTEREARDRGLSVLVGRARYDDLVKGEAMADESHFAKGVVQAGSGRVLGFSVIGPQAPELLQEVVTAMAAGMPADRIREAMHTFPSLAELVPETLANLR